MCMNPFCFWVDDVSKPITSEQWVHAPMESMGLDQAQLNTWRCLNFDYQLAAFTWINFRKIGQETYTGVNKNSKLYIQVPISHNMQITNNYYLQPHQNYNKELGCTCSKNLCLQPSSQNQVGFVGPLCSPSLLQADITTPCPKTKNEYLDAIVPTTQDHVQRYN